MIVLSYRTWSKMNIENSIIYFYFCYEVHLPAAPSMHLKNNGKRETKQHHCWMMTLRSPSGVHLPQSTFASGVLAITIQGLRHPGAPTTQSLAFSPALALHHLPANALQRETVRIKKSGLGLTRLCMSHH